MSTSTFSNSTLDLAMQLISHASVTPDDNGCQALLIDHLAPLGFHCETITSNGVTNLWTRRGTQQPCIVFAGHTDVVPTGALEDWQTPPFTPTIRQGYSYGRGAADMKSSIAAMVIAIKEFIKDYPEHPGSIGLLITSDEEGSATDGTTLVCKTLKARNEAIDYCVVGEPTSVSALGDTIKNGRRGSLSGKLVVHGIQGHIAYPQLAKNPIHLAAPALLALTSEVWDQGNDHYLPTSFQISNIHAGTGANNVTPAHLTIDFNFRFASSSQPADLKQRVHNLLDQFSLEYTIDWALSGLPFLTPKGILSHALSHAIIAETGINPALSTSGGTSDGRFIAQICPEVIEFGPSNFSIHQVNESIPLAQLGPLKNIYRRVLENILLK